MASFSLDDIRSAAESKYAHTTIEVDAETSVVLLNPLRMPKAKRDLLGEIQGLLEDESQDQALIFRDAIRTVAQDEAKADVLLDLVGDDMAVLVEIFTTYTEGTQAGEASASQG